MTAASIVALVVDLALVKVTLLVAVGAIASFLLRRSASAVAAVWLVTLVAIAVLPLTFALAPTWTVMEVEFPHELVPLPTTLLTSWAVVAAWRLWRIVADVRAATALVRRSPPATDTTILGVVDGAMREALPPSLAARVQVRVVPGLASPAVVGWRRPAVLLPADATRWPAEELMAALSHEGAHLARGDWAIAMCERVVGALLWMNPCVAIAFRHAALQRELCADMAAMRRGARADTYAATLLRVARTAMRTARRASGAGRPAAALPFAGSAGLETRIRALFDVTRSTDERRDRVAARLLPAALVLAGLVAPASLWTCRP